MRTLLLFRGAPGCGKSTYIKEHNLEQYVLSADTLRLMCQSAQETPAGQMEISPQNDDVVWEMLFKLLEVRMSHGEFTVIDATNSKTVEMNRYKNLAKQYRYRMYVIDMTDLPIEECKRRNAQREWLKRVPEAAIDKMYARFATQKVPSGVTVLPSTTDVMSDLNYCPNDFNQWKKIHVIGDIHGCYTCLSEYLGEMKDDELYIFVGDYLDRGIENVEVFKFLCDVVNNNRKNVILLEGNENGKKHKTSDAARYKALGNSIALPQWYWIFQKMKPYIGENPTLGSLFDGIGGFPLVFESTYGDGTAIWGSEIEPFCIAVARKHFPEKEIS